VFYEGKRGKKGSALVGLGKKGERGTKKPIGASPGKRKRRASAADRKKEEKREKRKKKRVTFLGGGGGEKGRLYNRCGREERIKSSTLCSAAKKREKTRLFSSKREGEADIKGEDGRSLTVTGKKRGESRHFDLGRACGGGGGKGERGDESSCSGKKEKRGAYVMKKMEARIRDHMLPEEEKMPLRKK